MPGFLITGTDTGVGKTVVGCGIAAALIAQGKRVGMLKPAETGCPEQDGKFYPQDAALLAGFAQSSLPLEEICPYRFAPPLAPSVAADMAGTSIEVGRIREHFQRQVAAHDVVIVEGAGGLLVPLNGRYSFADLAADLQLPILIVVGSKLGALNHALLTFHCAQARSLPILGYILNHPTPASDLAIQTNAKTLAGLTDVPCLGILPCLSLSGDVAADSPVLSQQFEAAIDMQPLLG
jgi:dethiobiotin synthetase